MQHKKEEPQGNTPNAPIYAQTYIKKIRCRNQKNTNQH